MWKPAERHSPWATSIIRPPDIHVVVDGLIFYRDSSSSSSSFFFFRRLISDLAEWNSTKIGHMLGSNCNLKTYVQNLGIPSPTNYGPQNHLYHCLFLLDSVGLGMLLGNWKFKFLNVLVYHSDHESTKGLLHCPNISWTLVHKRLKTGPDFLPTLIILYRPGLSHIL